METFTIGVFILSLRFSASSSCTPAHGTSVRVRAEPLHTVPVRLLVCLCLAARVSPDRSSATIHSVRDGGDRCSLLFLLCRVLKPPEFEDQDSASGGAQRASLGRPYLHAGDKALLFNSLLLLFLSFLLLLFCKVFGESCDGNTCNHNV